MEWIIQTKRLGLRKITRDDFENLCEILQDIEIMYAWEHAFTDSEVSEWIEKNLKRYENEGFSYFAAIEKDSNKFIGVIGPLVEEVDGKKHIGIAYILNKKYWGKGYAFEGAKACMDYAFDELEAHEVIAEIRPNNIMSCKLAGKLGMQVRGSFVKHYKGQDMPHLIYSRTKVLTGI